MYKIQSDLFLLCFFNFLGDLIRISPIFLLICSVLWSLTCIAKITGFNLVQGSFRVELKHGQHISLYYYTCHSEFRVIIFKNAFIRVICLNTCYFIPCSPFAVLVQEIPWIWEVSGQWRNNRACDAEGNGVRQELAVKTALDLRGVC
jgi:hypothetical protein